MAVSSRVRALAAGFVLVDAAVLGSFAVGVHDVSTTVAARPATPADHQVAPRKPPTTSTTQVVTTVGGGTAIQPGGGTRLTTVSFTTPGHVVSKPTKTGHGTGGGSTPTGGTVARSIAACPITITKNNASGGLQSLVQFAPAFGAFTPEAFAAASAYQPALELVGPLLAQYPRLAPVIGPYANQFVTQAAVLTNLLGEVLNPLYGPYKNQVVTAETKLAAALAPYSEDLAYSPLGGCVVQLENALVAQSTAP